MKRLNKISLITAISLGMIMSIAAIDVVAGHPPATAHPAAQQRAPHMIIVGNAHAAVGKGKIETKTTSTSVIKKDGTEITKSKSKTLQNGQVIGKTKTKSVTKEDGTEITKSKSKTLQSGQVVGKAKSETKVKSENQQPLIFKNSPTILQGSSQQIDNGSGVAFTPGNFTPISVITGFGGVGGIGDFGNLGAGGNSSGLFDHSALATATASISK
jgi:hypothetical protein